MLPKMSVLKHYSQLNSPSTASRPYKLGLCSIQGIHGSLTPRHILPEMQAFQQWADTYTTMMLFNILSDRKHPSLC